MAQSEARLETLWVVPKAMLQDPLWLERDAYDSAHYLMVPLHSAYADNRSGWIAEFEAFFRRFAERRSADGFDKLSLLNRSQFLYLVTEYLALNKARGNPPPFDLTPLIEDVRQAWIGSAWLWAACGLSSFAGMAQRLEWKLARSQTKPLHCRAIFDEEWYAFVNAANLVYVLGQAVPPFLKEIVAVAYRVLEEGGAWNPQQTRWLWQPVCVLLHGLGLSPKRGRRGVVPWPRHHSSASPPDDQPGAVQQWAAQVNRPLGLQAAIPVTLVSFLMQK